MIICENTWLRAEELLLIMTEVISMDRAKAIYQLINLAVARPAQAALLIKGCNSWLKILPVVCGLSGDLRATVG